MKRRTAGVMLLTALASLLLVAGAQAVTSITNTTSGGSDPYAPLNLNPFGWRFTARADTVTGEAICVEVHPMGDAGNFVRTQCALSGGSNPYDWTCNVFTGGIPQAFRSKTVQYQFHAAAYDTNCQGNTSAFTGFNWTFNTDPLAVSLQSLSAEPNAASPAWAAAGLLVAAGGISLLLSIRLLKSRR